jgi:hypothetical protein
MSNSKITVVLLALLTAIGVAAAGTIFKPLNVSQPPVAALDMQLIGAELCARNLKVFVTFSDPDSVKIHRIEPNQERPGRYFLSVSANTSVGRDNRTMRCHCETDLSKGKVTDMHCDQ